MAARTTRKQKKSSLSRWLFILAVAAVTIWILASLSPVPTPQPATAKDVQGACQSDDGIKSVVLTGSYSEFNTYEVTCNDGVFYPYTN